MFKTTMFRQLARSFSSKSGISKYIAPDSEERFRLAESAYGAAKEYFEKRDVAQAKIQIQDPFKYLSGVQGEGPAIASVSMMFRRLKKSIENQDNTCTYVKTESKIVTP